MFVVVAAYNRVYIRACEYGRAKCALHYTCDECFPRTPPVPALSAPASRRLIFWTCAGIISTPLPAASRRAMSVDDSPSNPYDRFHSARATNLFRQTRRVWRRTGTIVNFLAFSRRIDRIYTYM